jgi:radical SAM protein with 4Fe4S-binding SPASM domain
MFMRIDFQEMPMSHVRSLYFGGSLAEIGQKTLKAYQEHRPSEVIWNITNSCDLFCKHCYVNADFTKAARELTPSEALDLVNQIGEAGVPLLFITGGEPFSRPDLYAILGRAQEFGMKVVLSTNGLAIDDAAADRLKGFGIDYVAISMYGPEAFHDDYVGARGSFRRVTANIARLKARGIKVGIKTTVTEATFPHFFDLVEVAKGLGAGLVYACDLIASGRAVPLQEKRITNDQWLTIADAVVNDVLATPQGGLEYDIGANPSLAMVILEKLKARGADTAAGEARLRVKSACPVGRGLMGINSEGDVLPCSFVQDYTVGNVRDLGVRGAVEKLFALGHASLEGQCGTCSAADLCRGCRVKAYHDCGTILGEDRTCLVHTAGR